MPATSHRPSTRAFLRAATILLLGSLTPAPAQTTGPGNDAYRTAVRADGAVEVSHAASGATALFKPDFWILSRTTDPKLHTRKIHELEYTSAAWHDEQDEPVFDYFRAGTPVAVAGTNARIEGNTVRWNFPANPDFTLEASLSVPPGSALPVLKFHFRAKQTGWYSVGYAGAPARELAEIDAIWQPLIWQEKRFPTASILTPELACTLPATLATHAGVTYGVVADPSEIPFRFATLENSRFGVAVRNREGRAQPLLFAPVLGGDGSHLAAGDTFTFQARLHVAKGDAYAAYAFLARELFGFRDYRRNLTCTLNTTIENMISFALNDEYAGWNAELKAPDYRTDVKNSVKTVSALHALSIAIVTDNEEIYRRRAVPTIEYLMSREKYLFTPIEPEEREQSASHHLNGPAAEVSELAALELFSHGGSPVFSHYARALWDKPRALNLDLVSAGGSWQNALGLYRLSGDAQFLEQARRGADDYIAKRIAQPQTDFSDARLGWTGGQFWTDFAPKWIDLLQLYEASGDRKYLDAATEGAKRHANFVWVHQSSSERIVVNQGNKVGLYAFQNRLFANPQPMTAPEETIDAWQVSPTGLTPEASNTWPSNRAVFLAHHAPYLLRLYGYTGNTFFRDIARSAIVGRYANYPGYGISGEYSNIIQRADYPLRPLADATFSTFYYNHVWPHITLLLDFLVTDIAGRSAGNIDFPRRYAQGYAYLQCDVYGDRPGKFYGDENVRLWLPAGLLTADNVQLNYLAAYGNDALYLCFANQSDATVTSRVKLDQTIVPYDSAKIYPADVWADNHPPATAELRYGELNVTVSPKGITALRIKGIRVVTQFQQQLYHQSQPAPAESFHERKTDIGKITDMVLNFGPTLKEAYVWLQASEKELRAVWFTYRIGEGLWQKHWDTTFPFELSVQLDGAGNALEYQIDAQRVDGTHVTIESATLQAE